MSEWIELDPFQNIKDCVVITYKGEILLSKLVKDLLCMDLEKDEANTILASALGELLLLKETENND